MSSQKSTDDAMSEIARLRAEIETLRAAAEAGGKRAAHAAAAVADELGEAVHRQSDLLAEIVRERPMSALLVAGLAGFIIGRLAR
jgi:ElaB/YqjD/DUF883 family membrane-anchored ribosome-binding protein